MKLHSLHFFEKLQPLIANGIALDQALNIINKNLNNPIIEMIHEKIKQGSDLSSVLLEFPQFFSPMDYALLKAGESSGKLSDFLQKLIYYRKRQDQIRSQMKKALFYPMLVLSISFSISMALLVFVIPQFQTVFASFGAKLPWMTQQVIFLSKEAKSYGLFFLIFILMLLFSLKKYFRHSPVLQNALLKTPWLGKCVFQNQLSVFCYLISTAQQNGISLLSGLELAKNSSFFFSFQNALTCCQTELKQGAPLSKALHHQALLDSENIALLSVGEATGTLGTMLNLIAERLSHNTEMQLDYFSKLIEPLMMLFLALIAGTLIVAMYLPIFSMGAAIH